MNILVCVKQVPDTTVIKIDPVKHTLIREGVPSILNTFDAYALETALRVRESAGGKITVLSMGPEQAKEVLKECISVGLTELTWSATGPSAAATPWPPAGTLAEAIRVLEEQQGAAFDLIFCGQAGHRRATPPRWAPRSPSIWAGPCSPTPWRPRWRAIP